ncbi:MAG TPA: bifunctional glutamate N-acetyltransferase/amino-acid acetyltransferase ArgJ, partial [Lacipirellulaceae bacterium]|nr:bifunctional glutamate N-acetyltransferase/amino-acid acetyltransferase ArgJ [Lacipirellulaceae bacterium]
GFRAAGVYTGVKRNTSRLDLSLIASDPPALAVGVFTQNLVYAAPVKLCRQRTPSESIRAVVINSGNANACTGEQGERDATEMAERAAGAVGARGEETLVMSTGVIGELLPLEKILPGIDAAAARLADDEAALVDAARGMMTTDTRPKICSRTIELDGRSVGVCGIAKGAAMIGPNLATMLAVIMTDAPLGLDAAAAGLHDAADESFNCISVEGHTSTNDTVLLLANGAAGGPPLAGDALAKFQATLVEVCEDLAQSIPADGEGATHLITVEVHGCRTREDAVQVARAIANSPLVKTAVAGNDPNWGRIVSAAGYSGVAFDPAKASLHLNGSLLYEHGRPASFDGDAVSAAMAADRNTGIVLLLEEGEASARFWPTDLTAEYVRLNADYHA